MSEPIGPFVAIRSGDGTVSVERRVVLLSRDPGLASITGRLLSNGDRIAQFRSAAELSNWSTPVVAAVVLDSRPQARRLSYKQVRDRYDGPLIMLLDKGERRPDLPPAGPASSCTARSGRPSCPSCWARQPPSSGRSRPRSSLPGRATPPPSRRSRPGEAPPTGSTGGRRCGGGPVPGRPRSSPSWACCWCSASARTQSPCTPGCTNFGGAVAEIHPTEPLPADQVWRQRQPRHPAPRVLWRLVPAPGPHRRVPGGRRGWRADPVHQPHLHHRHQPALGPHQRRRGPRPSGHQPAPDHEPRNPPPTTNPPGTNPPPTTTPTTTAPPTTAPPTTAPPTTAPPTTDPPTTAPPTTAPPTTQPPTTAPPTTAPPTTAAVTTVATTAATTAVTGGA